MESYITPPIDTTFELATGTVAGREHRRLSKNNQDAYLARATPYGTIALVADGCGSTPHSEVGAWMWTRLVSAIFEQHLPAFWTPKFSGAQIAWILQLAAVRFERLAELLPGELVEVIDEFALATDVGMVSTPLVTRFFVAGDGLVVINGEVTRIDSAGNAPAYPAYGILHKDIYNDHGQTATGMAHIELQFDEAIPTAELDTFLIGTDGANDLITSAELPIPGKTELIGPIDRFWQDDRYYHNPVALQRYLNLINRETVRVVDGRLDREHGPLLDDTTLIVGRRKED
jgi:hypothetical protein